MSLNVGVIGAGAMGTAISQCIAPNTNKLLLYARRKEICDDINEGHINCEYHPSVKLHENIRAVNDLCDLKDVDVIFLCIPSSVMRQTMVQLNEIVSDKCIFVSTAKGIENKTNKRMSEVIKEETGRSAVVLSGPNIASEMMKNLPSATTIASIKKKDLEIVKSVLSTPKLKVNTNHDVIGTEFCGIIKNILAISQGICKGMGINDNAKFAVFTKSYNETKCIIEKVGGNRSTVDDYCGFGDIITASTLNVSRNHTLGIWYGQGVYLDEQTGVLFEGKNTAIVLKEICDKLNIECLTVNFVYDVINNAKVYSSNKDYSNYVFFKTKYMCSDKDGNTIFGDFLTGEVRTILESKKKSVRVDKFMSSSDNYSVVVLLDDNKNTFYIFYL